METLSVDCVKRFSQIFLSSMITFQNVPTFVHLICASHPTHDFREHTNNIDACRKAADAIRRCMNREFKDRDLSAKHVRLKKIQ